jgi:hypothetical protein
LWHDTKLQPQRTQRNWRHIIFINMLQKIKHTTLLTAPFKGCDDLNNNLSFSWLSSLRHLIILLYWWHIWLQQFSRTCVATIWQLLFLPLGVASCCASIQLVLYDAVNRDKVSIR